MSSGLTDFLLARVAEEEAVAKAAAARNGDEWTASHLDIGAWRIAGSKDIGANPRAYNGDTELWDDEGALGMHAETAAHVARFDPRWVLAECEAKRRIIAHLQPTIDDRFEASELVEWTTTTLRLLAAPYSSHPEFDPAWTVAQ